MFFLTQTECTKYILSRVAFIYTLPTFYSYVCCFYLQKHYDNHEKLIFQLPNVVIYFKSRYTVEKFTLKISVWFIRDKKLEQGDVKLLNFYNTTKHLKHKSIISG